MNFLVKNTLLGGRRNISSGSIYVEHNVYLFFVDMSDAYYSHDSDRFAVVVLLIF